LCSKSFVGQLESFLDLSNYANRKSRELLVGAYRSVIIRFIVPLYILITTIMLVKEGITCLKDVYLNISVTLHFISPLVFLKKVSDYHFL
jgi:hypothetical protein